MLFCKDSNVLSDASASLSNETSAGMTSTTGSKERGIKCRNSPEKIFSEGCNFSFSDANIST